VPECGDVPLEQTSRVAELAPVHLRYAEIGRRDPFCRSIAEGARESQGLLANSKALLPVAHAQALVDHQGSDSCKSELVAERPGEHFCLVERFPLADPVEWLERAAKVEIDVDGQLGPLPGPRKTA